MANEAPAMDYNLKYGGIDEALAGEGKSVDSCEDLYNSGIDNGLILIPKVIGVHQTVNLKDIESFEARAQDMAQRFVDMKYGTEDGVDGTLISLVYAPEVMDEKVLRTVISGKDVIRRLKLVGYRNMPDFSRKPIISPSRVEKLLSDLGSKKTKKAALTLLEREVEYFGLNLETYGLTRIEALNHSSLSRMVEQIKESNKREKEGDSESQGGSNLITDPLAIKLTELFEQLMKRHLEE